MKAKTFWLALILLYAGFLASIPVFVVQTTASPIYGNPSSCEAADVNASGTSIKLVSNSPVQVTEPLYLTATVTGTLLFSCTWDFGDASVPLTHTAVTNTFTVSHEYSYAGTYSVTLEITDAAGAGLSGTIPVEVLCYSLTVDLASSGDAQAGVPVFFTATVTGGTSPYSYTWDFGDQTPPAFGTTEQNLLHAEHRYRAGTWAVTLVVTDVHRCSSPVAETTVKISNARCYLPIVLKLYVPPTPPPPPSPVVNGGFEEGNLNGWDSGGILPTSVVPDVVGGTVYSGTWAALLGSPDYGNGGTGNIPVGSAWISQQITIPAGFTGTLSLAYRMQGYDGLNTDHFQVCLREIATSQQTCPVNASFSGYAGPFKDSGWLTATQLIPPTWQTVVIYLQHSNEIDDYWNTWTYVDEVQVSLKP